MTLAISGQFPRVRAAWQGRISGCLLGKPVEVLSFQQGRAGLENYLREVNALPLRDYIPLLEGSLVEQLGRDCCRGHITRAEPDDDLNYTLLALLLLEEVGTAFDVADVARLWLRYLPAGATWTAERAAYQALLNHMDSEFVNGAAPGFDISVCADNEFNEWIGAQIRADLYGWVCPGRPDLAAALARKDASLSHKGEGVNGAAIVAALGATLAVNSDFDAALELALKQIPADSEAASAVKFGRSLVGEDDAVSALHHHFDGMPPVHTLNNLAVVIWALFSANGDFSAGVGNAVMAGWDTDCNGATVGGLLGIAGTPIPENWTAPWNECVAFSLAGISEERLEDLVSRTVAVSESMANINQCVDA